MSVSPKQDFDKNSTIRKTEPDSSAQGAEMLELTLYSADTKQIGLTWLSLLKAVEGGKELKDIFLTHEKQLPLQAKFVFLAAAAFEVGNWKLLKQLEASLCTPKDSELWFSQRLHRPNVFLAALHFSIVLDFEELACHLAEQFSEELPVYLVHRAGERGMLRLLKCFSDFQTRLKSVRGVQTAVRRFKSLIQRSSLVTGLRFEGHSVLPEDVLKWAFVSGGEAKVREALTLSLNVTNDSLTKVLLTEGLTCLFEELVARGDVTVTVKTALQMLRTPDLLLSSEVMETIIALLSDPQSSLEAICLLAFVQGCDCNLVRTKCIYAKLLAYKTCQNAEKSPLVNHKNPLLLCIALSEISQRLSDFKLPYKQKFCVLSAFFRELAFSIQNQFSEYQQLKVLYTEKAFGGRCVLDIITAHTERYRVLLKSEIVVAIVQDLWTGGEQAGLNFHSLCLITHIFTEQGAGMFSLHRRPLVKTNCLFQLHYWKTNASLKAFVEALMLIGLYGIGLTAVIIFVKSARVVADPSESAEDISEANAQLASAARLANSYLAMSISLVLFLFEKCAYHRLLSEPQTFDAKDLLDTLLFLNTAVMQALMSNLSRRNSSLEGILTMSESTFSLIFLLAGLRMAFTLLILKAVGPMLRMVFIIMKDILTFAALYVLALVTFSAFFDILFYRNTELFGTFLVTMRTLITWSVSGVDFSGITHRETLVSFFGVMWMFISAIILLNLLIAVLSTRYEELAPQCVADYVSTLYSSYRQTRYEWPYGALVVTPAPMSWLTSPLLVCYSIAPSSAKHLDRYFVLLSYQFMFVAGTGLFIGYCFACMGLAYCYVAFSLVRKCSLRTVPRLMLWLIVAPWYLSFVSLKSLRGFWSVLYEEPEVDDAATAKVKDVYQSISRMLKRVCRQREGTVLVSMADISPLISLFPKDTLSYSIEHQLTDVVSEIVANRPRISHDKRKLILDLFDQFKSYHTGVSSADKETIDVRRMSRFFQLFQANPERLSAVNIYFTQKALIGSQGETQAK